MTDYSRTSAKKQKLVDSRCRTSTLGDNCFTPSAAVRPTGVRACEFVLEFIRQQFAGLFVNRELRTTPCLV